MTVPLVVSSCGRCGWRGFPPRLWCPTCGGDALGETEVDSGKLEGTTVLRHAAGREPREPVTLGTVRLEGGGRAVARIVDAAPGDDVTVSVEDGAVVARPAEPC